MLRRAQFVLRVSNAFSQFNHSVSMRPFFGTIAGYWKSRNKIKKEDEKFQGESRQAAFVNIDISTYGKDVQQRIKRRLNWNVNRYQQRQVDDVYKNQDIMRGHRRDISQMLIDAQKTDIQSFYSVEEVLYFIESLFSEGLTEQLVNKALDALIRDSQLFNEEDLQREAYLTFLRQLSSSMLWFEKGQTFVKISHFLDIYCVPDPYLWINLENYIIKSDNRFSPKEYISILGSFAGQGEGSNDFYDMYEFMYSSDFFKDLQISDLISLGYFFYIVHHGSQIFFKNIHRDLIHKLSENVSNFDLLRVLQTFCNIAKKHILLMVKLEVMFKTQRINYLDIDELSCCACGFALSKLGSDSLFQAFQLRASKLIDKVDESSIRDLTAGLIISRKASKQFYYSLLPKIIHHRGVFTTSDLCKISYSYHKKGVRNNLLSAIVESKAKEALLDESDIKIELLALIVETFTSTRLMTREFQKLLEYTVLKRLKDVQRNEKVLFSIAAAFDASGLVSKSTMFQVQKAIKELRMIKVTA